MHGRPYLWPSVCLFVQLRKMFFSDAYSKFNFNAYVICAQDTWTQHIKLPPLCLNACLCATSFFLRYLEYVYYIRITYVYILYNTYIVQNYFCMSVSLSRFPFFVDLVVMSGGSINWQEIGLKAQAVFAPQTGRISSLAHDLLTAFYLAVISLVSCVIWCLAPYVILCLVFIYLFILFTWRV